MTTMTSKVHAAMRKALEAQRNEAEKEVARLKVKTEQYEAQGKALTPGFRSIVDFWTTRLADTNAAMDWLHAEFYNEWGEWRRND